MDVNEQTFRRAAMGGFNRQDVLNYIEAAAREAVQKREDLVKENAALRAEKEQAEAAAREALETAALLEGEEKRLSQALAEKQSEVGQVRDALEEQRVETQCLQAELDHLREKVGRMESGATAYAELRDRTGTIELEAHQRALLIEQTAEQKTVELRRQAEEDARKLQAECEQLLTRLYADYTRLRGQLEATISGAAREMGQVERALEQVKTGFAAHDGAVKTLLETCRKRPEPSSKEPKPLPLREG